MRTSMTLNNLHLTYANSYRTMTLQRCCLHMNWFLLHPTVSEKTNKQYFNSKLELYISTLDWPVWDVFITFCFRQLNIRRKKLYIFNAISRGYGFLTFKQKSSLIETLIITYAFTPNLHSCLPGTVVVKYASSKGLEYNLVVNVVFYCYFLEKLFWRHIKPFASRLTAAWLRAAR